MGRCQLHNEAAMTKENFAVGDACNAAGCYGYTKNPRSGFCRASLATE